MEAIQSPKLTTKPANSQLSNEVFLKHFLLYSLRVKALIFNFLCFKVPIRLGSVTIVLRFAWKNLSFIILGGGCGKPYSLACRIHGLASCVSGLIVRVCVWVLCPEFVSILPLFWSANLNKTGLKVSEVRPTPGMKPGSGFVLPQNSGLLWLKVFITFLVHIFT